MKKVLNLFLLVAVTLAGTLALINPIFAEEGNEETPEETPSGNSLRLTPVSTSIKLTEGAVLEDKAAGCKSGTHDTCSLEIQNTGKTTFTYKVYVTPYMEYTSEEGNEVTFEDMDGRSYSQIARWIKVKNPKGEYVDEATYTIEPGATQSVGYKITIPDNIPGGSQYAVIWAEMQNNDADAGGIVTLGRVGMKVMGKSNSNTIESAEIHDINLTRFSVGGKLEAFARIKNTGNTDFIANYSYSAKTIFGKEIYKSSESRTIFPEADYKLDIKWDEKEVPLLGLFTVDFKINGGGASEDVSCLVLVMPIWVLILVILLLTIVIFWIIIIIRKRKERKIRKLV